MTLSDSTMSTIHNDSPMPTPTNPQATERPMPKPLPENEWIISETKSEKEIEIEKKQFKEDFKVLDKSLNLSRIIHFMQKIQN